jgi:hypothetical protein
VNAKAMMRKQGLRWFWVGVAVLVLLTFGYAEIYIAAPFSDDVNNFLSNAFTVLAAFLSALIATLVWQRYEKTEPLRRIWRWMSIGLWLWTLAEAIWAYYFIMNLDANKIGPQDALWTIGFIFFGLSLYAQFMLLFRPDPAVARRRVVFALVGFFGLTILAIFLYSFFSHNAIMLDTVVNIFYPCADLAVGVAALWLARSFRNGSLAYAWLGLFVFTLSDLLYAWLELSGVYEKSVEQGNYLSAVSDITYVLAYLIVALGCFTQWLLINYGPIFRREPNEPKG